jgi:transcriptional regulator with PAS, ATPase and Fis domain
MFLDEIIDLPLGAQAKLLRVLEGGEIRPVGDSRSLHVDVRVISACNRPLAEIVGDSLREDLFFRISTIVIQLPPLRQRHEDLYLLSEHFLRQFSQLYGRTISLDRTALDALLAYSFPGNVRELSHILESAVAVSIDDPQVIKERDISPLLRAQTPPTTLSVGNAADFSLESMEKFAIRQALRIASGNKSQAAELLGLSRGSLYRKLREHGLEEKSLQGDDAPSSS